MKQNVNKSSVIHKIEEISEFIDRRFLNWKTNYDNKSCDEAKIILDQLRPFIEHIFYFWELKKENKDPYNYPFVYDDFKSIKDKCSKNRNAENPIYKVWFKFHWKLQNSVSHNYLNNEQSERLLSDYISYLLEIQNYTEVNYGLKILENISFYLEQSKEEEKHLFAISEYLKSTEIKNTFEIEDKRFVPSEFLYKVVRCIPRKYSNHKFYEVILNPFGNFYDKENNIIAFSNKLIENDYPISINFEEVKLEIYNNVQEVLFISDYEFKFPLNFFKEFIRIFHNENISNLNIFKEVGFKLEEIYNLNYKTLFELIVEDNDLWDDFIDLLLNSPYKEIQLLADSLVKTKNIITKEEFCEQTLRYLIKMVDPHIVKNQIGKTKKEILNNTFLAKKTLPFEHLPLTFSLVKHNPKYQDLINSINLKNIEHQIIAKKVIWNAQNLGYIATKISDIDLNLEELKKIVEIYNNLLWTGHKEDSKLCIKDDYIYINQNVTDLEKIIHTIKKLNSNINQENTKKLREEIINKINLNNIDDNVKKILNLFQFSSIGIIHGPAGTGKTTKISKISELLSDKRKIFLSKTHTAVRNLKNKIKIENSKFLTIDKYLKDFEKGLFTEQADIMIIDEFSCVSNKEMRRILETNNFGYLLLVGDFRQNKSIELGNWHEKVLELLSKSNNKNNILELNYIHRIKTNLLKRIRELSDALIDIKNSKKLETFLEELQKGDFSKNPENLNLKNMNNFMLLAPNYNGLFGINSLNKMAQSYNPEREVIWGIYKFKKNDPILFKYSDFLDKNIFTNLEGTIKDIKISTDNSSLEYIEFDVEVKAFVTNPGENFSIIYSLEEERMSGIRFRVYKNHPNELKNIIPFNLKYCISIHKAQSLEEDNVILFIDENSVKNIDYNIFYTAITRPKVSLSIYWTKETERKFIEKLKNDIKIILERNKIINAVLNCEESNQEKISNI
ncbi:ATP-dependent DNA helicase [Mycoplasmopsis columboralis]|nr:ATP-dependent RecD-like DNA helicase [Mycoplasmopsis columboralis]